VFEVTNTLDAGPGSLREAIELANANPGSDKIVFAKSAYGVIALSADNGELLITDDLTVQGPGAGKLTVSGADVTRVFGVLPAGLASDPFITPTLSQLETAPNVKFTQLTVSNGLATDALGINPANPDNPGFAFGGGIYNVGGTIQLDGVHMTNNVVAGFVTAGGAIANEFGGSLSVKRSHFEGNSSKGILIGVGGAITSDLGPAIDDTTGEATTSGQPEVKVERSSFYENSASATIGYIEDVAFSGLGAAGAILNLTGLLEIDRSHFEGNTATGGAAIAGSTTAGPALGGAVLSGNFSPFGGGQSVLDVTRSTFTDNAATGGTAVAPGLAGGQAGGGAIALVNLGEADLTRNQFTGNAAQGGEGADASGGVGNGGAVSLSSGVSAALSHNRMTENSATGGTGAAGRGGAVGIEFFDLAGFVPLPAAASVTHDHYAKNTATAGGGIFNAGDLSLRHTTLVGNEAVSQADTFIDFYPGYLFQGAALGGGISNIGTLEIAHTRIHDNVAQGADGAVGPNILLGEATVPTYPGIVVGAGLHTITQATVSHSSIKGNVAQAGDGNQGSFAGVGNGGGIYNDGSLRVSHSQIRDNVLRGGDNNVGDINAGGAYGAGISSGSVTALAGLRSAELIVENSLIEGNEAISGVNNAGLFPVPEAHAPNAAIGGGILVFQGTGSIDSSLVTGNSTYAFSGGTSGGGGVFALGFVGPIGVSLNRTVVSGNSATGAVGTKAFGGGIASSSLGSLFGGRVALELERSLIFGNLAEGGFGANGLGGGLFLDSDTEADIVKSLIFRNRAVGGDGGEGIGGGVYNNQDGLDLVHSFVFANFASTDDDNISNA
jgi:hypothetical protein